MPPKAELSYPPAPEQRNDVMTETVAPLAKPVPLSRSRKPATVSASALAQHLDCTRTYIGKLEAEGVIQRQGDSFPLDESRVAYLRYLRRERRQSPRSEADAALVAAKTEMLQLRLMEKKRELLSREDFDEAIDSMAGIVITHLSGMAARCSNDLMVRRKIDAVVREVRKEMAKAALAMADKSGEPPLSG
jgi:phage terminase Nu1 subunit (DNA packaging protein)